MIIIDTGIFNILTMPLIKYLKRIKPLIFILIGLGTILLIGILLGLIFPNDSIKNPILLENRYYTFIMGVIIAPILETIIFQATPFYFVERFIKIKQKQYIYIFISPILFIHYFSVGYVITSYLVGCIFAFMYYVSYYRKENAIKLVTLIHFLNNLIAYSIHYLC